jgi:DNA mismatch repair protein MutS
MADGALTDPDAINAARRVSHLIGNHALSERCGWRSRALPTCRARLSRLALNRGGPRDLGAILAGLGSRRNRGRCLPAEMRRDHLAAAVSASRRLPGDIAVRLAATLDDELAAAQARWRIRASGIFC